MIFAGLVGGIVGARVYYLVQNWDDVSNDLLGNIFSGSGLVWYGGAIGGALAVCAWAWRRGFLGLALLDLAATPLALGYAIGRIGCQLSGDGDYGKASDVPWAMSYPDGTVPTDDRVHPTPVYESIAMALVAWGLWSLRDRVAPGILFALYLVLSGLERFLVEFLRRNDQVWAGLTVPQIESLVLMAIGAGWIALASRRRPCCLALERCLRPWRRHARLKLLHHAQEPAQRLALKLGVVLGGAVVAALEQQQPLRLGRARVELLGVLVRDLVVALRVDQQERLLAEVLDGVADFVLLEPRDECRRVDLHRLEVAARRGRLARRHRPHRLPASSAPTPGRSRPRPRSRRWRRPCGSRAARPCSIREPRHAARPPRAVRRRTARASGGPRSRRARAVPRSRRARGCRT